MSTPKKPISRKEEIQANPDNKIDQDFKGYPHGNANEETITPSTEEEKKVADMGNKDGEKRFNKNSSADEQESDGSANAFSKK